MSTSKGTGLQIVEDTETKRYSINEVFYSIQGEGVRTGTANVFVRFQGCNMKCDLEPSDKSPGGFQCDTEFESGRKLTLDELNNYILDMQSAKQGHELRCKWLILTGGEPALQVDKYFCDYFHAIGYKLAIETNGSINLPKKVDMSDPKNIDQFGMDNLMNELIDWITVSPKVAEHCIRQRYANEVKYVRGYGQGIPGNAVQAEHYLISPAFDGDTLDKRTMEWCIRLCLENPKWRLSCQQHKWWKVR